MKQYKSIAQWNRQEVSLSDIRNISTDEHETESAAQAVCRRLEREGFGGNGKIFPIKTWVEKINP